MELELCIISFKMLTDKASVLVADQSFQYH